MRAELLDTTKKEGFSQRYKLLITIFGDGKHQLSHVIQSTIRNAHDGRQVVITHEPYRHNSKRYTALRDFNSIVLNPETENKLLHHISWFKRSKSYFRKHGLTYKTAILLKGPPGTGKTSISRAVANYLNYNMFILNMTALMEKGTREAQVPQIPENSLILIEDIDKSLDTSEGKAIQTLMQMLDGMLSCDNTAFVITTNFPDKLPAELIRPGRINLQLDVGLFSITEAKRLAALYEVPYSIIQSLPEAIWSQPSALHEFVVNYSSREQENNEVRR